MTKKNCTEKKIDTEVFFSVSIHACLSGNEKQQNMQVSYSMHACTK